MKTLRFSLLGLILLAVALPASASADRSMRCEGIGETITKLRSKGQPCDDARTLAAMWAETVASGGNRVERIHGYRCVRSNPPGPGGAVRCAKDDGAFVVAFRYRLS
ncbi:MAG: hypothetical protein QOE75_2772 [Solirubrobacterales bacterium]|jgi:hypothetical protein|nr:hypothetical protein [Solirubrobacterales bacterium]